jgi:hypothetical protein
LKVPRVKYVFSVGYRKELEDDYDFRASARKENLELELRFAAPIYLSRYGSRRRPFLAKGLSL